MSELLNTSSSTSLNLNTENIKTEQSTKSMSRKKEQSDNLIAHQIPLTGKHLIEASAGTGKTYNITRIYLRMLLERQLPVERILVMTFTKDATQELKGRIDSSIRDALANWESLIVSDPFYQAMSKKVTAQQAQLLLTKALLCLDEAAIFTIHGFCQRILSEHAFSTDMSFDVTLETDMSGLIEQATQDCYRILAAEQPNDFLLLSEFWQTPHSFIDAFAKAINRTHTPLSILSPEHIIDKFTQLIHLSINQLTHHKTLIYQVLIDKQKGDKQTERIEEYNHLIDWLNQLVKAPKSQLGKMPTTFYHGTRYARSPDKPALLAIFEPVKQVKSAYESLAKMLNKAHAFTLVREAIYSIREKIKAQKQQANILGFDDLISSLAMTLNENPELAQRICYDYPVALVDEFQDTDPEQFAILKAIYRSLATTSDKNSDKSTAAVFMIGDPKQAIYGFRSGDVFAYLAAREQCQYQWLMDTNWRSSEQMIHGYNRLFYGDAYTTVTSEQALKTFGYNIPYWPVKPSSAAKAELTNVIDNDSYQALQFVHFEHEKSENQKVPQSFRSTMAIWCANEISRLLSSNTNSLTCDSSTVVKPVQAQHIAVLVRDGTEAKEIKQALVDANIASVYLSNRSNLFNANEAKQLLTLLKGVLYCDNDSLFSAALALPLLNYHPEAYYQLQQNQQAWQALKVTFETLRKHWIAKSFISMALKLLHNHVVIPKASQDRSLTNLLHLFELLQIASQRHSQPHELIYWFEQHLTALPNIAETELRLESDSNLIKIVTQHGSKGLEYPVVFIPFASRYKNPLKLGAKNIQLIEYHDENKKLHLSIDGSDEAKAAMVAENHAETIRLLYVAITRAEQRCYVLTTDFEHADKSPIGATLKAQPTLSLVHALNVLVENEGIGLTTVAYDKNEQENEHEKKDVNTCTLVSNSDHHKEYIETVQPAKFNCIIERDWWLSSFSALTRHTSHGGISTPDRDNDPSVNNDELDETKSHLMRFHMVKGAQTGNFLHDVFEALDFNSPNWEEALERPLIRYHYLLAEFSVEELIHWLQDVLHTPLQQLTDQSPFSLSMLTMANTLREVEFYFPMKEASMAALANLLSEYRNINRTKNEEIKSSEQHLTQNLFTNPTSSYKPHRNTVNLPLYRQLKGMMHGFIDLIFEQNGKYYVCDYKSSHLGNHFDDYAKEQIQQSMEGNYYDLQYLIYSLALHRYLKAQRADYQPEEHFGGVYYFYLRGMSSENSLSSQVSTITNTINIPKPITTDTVSHGVYFTTISGDLLNTLDALFDESATQKGSTSDK